MKKAVDSQPVPFVGSRREPRMRFDPWEHANCPRPCFPRGSHLWDDKGRQSLSNIPARCLLAGKVPAPGSRIVNRRLQTRRVWITGPVSAGTALRQEKQPWLLLHHGYVADDCGWVKPCRHLNGKVCQESRPKLRPPSPLKATVRTVAPFDRSFLPQPGAAKAILRRKQCP